MTKSSFVCQECGYSQVGWAGKCPNCGTWGSLVETFTSRSKAKNKRSKTAGANKPVFLTSIKTKKTSRMTTKIPELDRVLGGGLVGGQVILLAGEPGIGKSTLLLQLCQSLGDCLYASGEESAPQIKLRAERLGVKKKTISILETTNVDEIVSEIESNNKLSLVVVDSIQTMATSDLAGVAGSVGQVRECAFRLLTAAKSKDIVLFMVGHVTKGGLVAGPSVLAHIVDTVLWFEGDKSLTLRLLRANKNRFGPTDEVGIFTMENKGLISLSDPEKVFLTKKRKNIPGSVTSSVMQGTRPIMVEVQSLVVPSKLAFPKRIAQGIDSRRLEILVAIMIRRLGLPLYEYDCFVNVAGGISAKDPGLDLAVCLSIASSFFNKPIPIKAFAIGEVGLLGEVREVVAEEKRLKEARRLGFTEIINHAKVNFLGQAVKRYLK